MFWFWKKREAKKKQLHNERAYYRGIGADDIDDATLKQVLDEYNPDAKRLTDEYCKIVGNGKKNLLVVDDSVGIISLVKDAIDELGITEEHNIIAFSSAYAGVAFEYFQRKCPVKIDAAIIDLVFGGVVRHKDGTLKIEGMDVFRRVYERNPNVQFLFYTGNSLNRHMPKAKRIMDAFRDITGRDIGRYVLYKAEHPIGALATSIEKMLKEQTVQRVAVEPARW